MTTPTIACAKRPRRCAGSNGRCRPSRASSNAYAGGAMFGVAVAAVVIASSAATAPVTTGSESPIAATTVPGPTVSDQGPGDNRRTGRVSYDNSRVTSRRRPQPARTCGRDPSATDTRSSEAATWIVGDNPLSVFRTTDDGAHWTDGTPTGSHASNDGLVDGFSARDDRNAVLAISTGANTETLLHTTDGGATWTTAIAGAYESQYFSFVTAQQGWVEASLGAAAGSEAVDILRTRDGGAHWDVMSRSPSLDAQDPGTTGALDEGCDKTGIGFVDDNTGFATGICNSPGYYFYATHDAGRTWKPQTLPTPPGIAPTNADPSLYWEAELLPPVFDGPNGAGILISTVVTNNTTATHHDYVYRTRDRGAHWSLADPPLRDATWARVVDANNWWAGNATTLTHTSDAGAHWTTIPNTGLDLGIAPGLSDLQFPTAANGWALVGDRSTGVLRLLSTDDGGRTWRPVPLPKTH